MTPYGVCYVFKQLGRGHLAAVPRSQEEQEFSSDKQNILPNFILDVQTLGKEHIYTPAFCCTILSHSQKDLGSIFHKRAEITDTASIQTSRTSPLICHPLSVSSWK